MTQHTHDGPRETLNLRIRAQDRALIDRAAQTLGKNRTQFIVDVMRAAAADVVLGQTLVELEPDDFDAFVARMDAPGDPSPELVATMSRPAPWDAVR